MSRTPVRWNSAAIFREKAIEARGIVFDYSLVEDHHVNGVDSEIPIICTICFYYWTPTINNHVNHKRGCPGCSGRAPLTLTRILMKARSIHGDSIDYTLVMEIHIQSAKSKLPLTCNICKYYWEPTINAHTSNRFTGCPDCAGVVPWTLIRFIERGVKIHGLKYNYSLIREHHIVNQKSLVPITCNICSHYWKPTINAHVWGKGCPECGGTLKWTLARLLSKFLQIHGVKFDYSKITENHIVNQDSRIPIKCNICKYKWEPTISGHVCGKGCPDCAGNAPWTLERLLIRAFKIHGNRYDYSQVTENHVENCRSLIPIICNNCKESLLPDIDHHINSKRGCHCFFNRGSKAGLDWLKSIEERDGIVIQCATSIEGEFKIRAPSGQNYRADGYHAPTNTIYEFYGDYWHGNPKMYDMNAINGTSRKTYGELYHKTIERENYIKSLGYNVIITWDTPFEVLKFLLSFDQIVAGLNTKKFLFYKFLPEYQVIPHNPINFIVTFYGKDGNIYLSEVQYNQEIRQIYSPL
jgi:hypothetical protein